MWWTPIATELEEYRVIDMLLLRDFKLLRPNPNPAFFMDWVVTESFVLTVVQYMKENIGKCLFTFCTEISEKGRNVYKCW